MPLGPAQKDSNPPPKTTAILIPGHSRDVISRNIAELRRVGSNPRQAVKLAYDQARLTGGVQVKESRRR